MKHKIFNIKNVSKKIIFLLFVLLQLTINAQESNKLFVDANKLYQQEKFNKAIDLYLKIEQQNVQSAELFYNLANAYYRTNKVAPSIYYYEKALQLKPNDKDVKFNLKFAQKMTIDNIEKMPTTIFQKISKNFIQKLSSNSWSYVTIIFVFLFAILFLFYHFSFSTIKKRMLFIASNLSIILLLISLFFAFHTFKITKNNKYAIIFAQQTSVKNAPILSSNEVFQLHEGTKVNLLEHKDNWTKIKIEDGQIGWINTGDLKAL